MAERRMFAKSIIDSDVFLDMPLSSQALYFHLSMRADDDGFVNSPKKIARVIGANEDDLRILFTKRYILGFESGIIVVKHWKIHNYIQKDRYKSTLYQEEFKTISTKENKSYTENELVSEVIEHQQDTDCIQNVSKMDTQVRLGKASKGKVRIVEDNIYADIIDDLNFIINASYKSTTKRTKSLIQARLKEGFTLDNFKTVNRKKSAEWISNSEMSKYLRPETLYGTKFESYLNQKEVVNNIPKHLTGLHDWAKQEGLC